MPRPFEIMMAKVWSMGLVVLVVSGLSLMLMVKGVLGVPIEAIPIPLFMRWAALSLFATTSIGILWANSSPVRMPQLGLLMILVLLPLQMLSLRWFHAARKYAAGGGDIMPTMPTTHFCQPARAILLSRRRFEYRLPQFLTLLAIGGRVS